MAKVPRKNVTVMCGTRLTASSYMKNEDLDANAMRASVPFLRLPLAIRLVCALFAVHMRSNAAMRSRTTRRVSRGTRLPFASASARCARSMSIESGGTEVRPAARTDGLGVCVESYTLRSPRCLLRSKNEEEKQPRQTVEGAVCRRGAALGKHSRALLVE